MRRDSLTPGRVTVAHDSRKAVLTLKGIRPWPGAYPGRVLKPLGEWGDSTQVRPTREWHDLLKRGIADCGPSELVLARMTGAGRW